MRMGRAILAFIFLSSQGFIFPSPGLAVTPDDISGTQNLAGQNNASIPAGQNTESAPKQGTSGNGVNTQNTAAGFFQDPDNPLSPPDTNVPRTNVGLSSLTPSPAAAARVTTLANPILPPPDKAHGGVDVNVLDWFGAADGDRYEIFRREFGQTSDSSWGQTIASLSGELTRFIDTDKTISKDKAYQYKVVAYRANQIVNPNVTLKQSVNYDLPDQGLQPQNVLVLLNKNPNADHIVEWASQNGADYYQVSRRKSGETQWTSVDFLSAAELKYTDKAIPKGEQYEYKVLAYKGTQALNSGNPLAIRQSVDSGLGLVNLARPADGLKTLTEPDLLALLKLPRRDAAVYAQYGIEITNQGDIMVPTGVYYAIRRGIPKENIVALTDIPTEERWEVDMVTGVYTPGSQNDWPYNFPETNGILDKTKSVLSIAQGGSWGDHYRLVAPEDNDLQKTYSLAGGGSTQFASTVFQLENGTQVDFQAFQNLWAHQWSDVPDNLNPRNPFAKIDSITVIQDGRLVDVATKVTLYNKPMLDFQNKVINPVAQQMIDRGIASRILSVVSAYHFPISLPSSILKYSQVFGNGRSWEGMLSQGLSEIFQATNYQYDGGHHLSRITGDGGFITTRLDGFNAEQVVDQVINDAYWAEQHPELFNNQTKDRRAYIDWLGRPPEMITDLAVVRTADEARGVFMVRDILDDTKWRLSTGEGGFLNRQYRIVTPGDNDLQKTYSFAGGGSSTLKATIFEVENKKEVDFQTFNNLWTASQAEKKFFIIVEFAEVIQDGRKVFVAQKVSLKNYQLEGFDFSFLQAANKVGESGFFGQSWTPLDLSTVTPDDVDLIRLGKQGDPFVVASNIRHAMDDIFFYTGWYGVSHNFSSLEQVSPFHMATGAVAYHLESFSAETFRTLKGNEYASGFLNRGAAAVMGAVYEPGSRILQPAELTHYLMSGYSLGEAVFYADPRNKGEQAFNAINADPLYKPFPSSARPNPQVSVQKLTDSSGGTQVEAGERHILSENAWGQQDYREYDKAGNLIREVFADGRTYLHLKDGTTAVMKSTNTSLDFSRTRLNKVSVQANGNLYLSLSLYDASGKRLDGGSAAQFNPQNQFNYSYVPGTQRLASASYQDGTGTWRAWTTPGANGSLDLHYKKAGTELFVLEGIDSETPVEVLIFMASSMPFYVEQMKNYRAAIVSALMIREPNFSQADIELQIPNSFAEASNIPGQLLYEITRRKPTAGRTKGVLKNVNPLPARTSAETYLFKPFAYDPARDPKFLTYEQGVETTSPDGTRLIFHLARGDAPPQLIYEISSNSLPRQYHYSDLKIQTPFEYVEISTDGSWKYYTLDGQPAVSLLYVGYSDKGFKTLAEAVQMAHSGDVIQIAAGTYQVTGKLDFPGKNLQIRADAGQGPVIFDGGHAASSFAWVMGGNTNITFDNVTFKNFLMNGEQGIYTNGGVFRVGTGGHLNLRNTIFENNSGDFGGAIHVSEEAHLFVINSVFRGNKAVGGAVICATSNSEVKLINTVFDGNEVGGSYGGGAVYSRDSKLSVRNSLFINNRASTGSVIQMKGTAAVDMENVTMTGNHAQLGNGAINLDSAGSRLTMSKSIIFGNEGMDIRINNSGAVANVTQSFLQGTSDGIGNKTGDPKLLANYTVAADSTARSAGDVWSWGYNIPQGTIVSKPLPNASTTPPVVIRPDQITPTQRPVDTVKPTGKIIVKEEAGQGEVTLLFEARDNQSVVTEMAGSWDGKEWGKDPVAFVSQFTVRAPWSMTGEHQFFVKYKDAAGNWSDPIESNKFTFTPVTDTVKPTGTMNIAFDSANGKVTLNFGARDDKTKTKDLEIRGSWDGGKTWGNPPVKFMNQYVVAKAPWTAENNYTFKVQYKDWAGNWSDPIESNSIHYTPPQVSNASLASDNSPADLALAVNILIEKDPVTNVIKSVQVGKNGTFLTSEEILNGFDANHDSVVTADEFESRRNTFKWDMYRSTPVRIQLSNGATQTQAEEMLKDMDQSKKYLASLNLKSAPPASIFLGDDSHGNYGGPDGWHLSADPAHLKEAVLEKVIQNSLLTKFSQLGYTGLEAFSRYFLYAMLGYEASRIQGNFLYQISLEALTGNNIYNAYQTQGLSQQGRDQILKNVANNNMALTQTLLGLRQKFQTPASFDNVVLKTLDLLKNKVNPAGLDILAAVLNAGISASSQQTVLSIFQQHGIAPGKTGSG